jgi:hypothetical protein
MGHATWPIVSRAAPRQLRHVMPRQASVETELAWGPFALPARFALAAAPAAEAEEIEKKGQRYAWIQISKTGDFSGHPDGPFRLGRAEFQSAIDELERQQNPIAFDYEHASASCIPTHSPAAGWTKQLEIRGEPGREELWAYTRLTKRAVQEIQDDEYRFISPTWMFNHPDRVKGEERMVPASLHSVALTNVPFLDGMQPITLKGQMSRLASIGRLAGIALAAAAKGTKTTMDNLDPNKTPTEPPPPEEPGDATDDTALVERLMQVLGLGDRAALGAWMDEKAKGEKQPATESALKLALERSRRSEEELEALRREKAEREVRELVAAGRALAEEEQALLDLRMKDPELFTKLTATRKAVVPAGRESRVQRATGASGAAQLVPETEVERRIAANLKAAGMTDADVTSALRREREKEIGR